MLPSLRSKRLARRWAGRLGFTLIELLAVILIIGILAGALIPMALDAIEAAKVTGCAANLDNIHKGIKLYEIKYKELPRESGVRFFAQLYSREAMAPSKTNAERLTCPAVDKGALAIGQIPWQEWWTDLEGIDGSYSAYAGRDTKNYPMRRITAGEPLIADDNDPTMNHATTTNVLYGDGSVQTFELILLREDGVLGPDEEVVYVGPDSPVEDLRKLSLD